MKLKNIISILNKIAPPYLAMHWDTQIGLQLGDKDQDIQRVFVCLDMTNETIAAAISVKADLIVAHHALIWKPLTTLALKYPVAQQIKKLMAHDMAVFVMHTNWDAAVDGVNWTLARAEGLDPLQCEVLEPTYTERLCKFVVFVPEETVAKVHEAIAQTDAGHIGNYSDCTFRTQGEGTFKPLEGTKPYIGSTGNLEKVKEVRIETVIAEQRVGELLNAVRAVHPYEEMAYDIYPLHNKGNTYGIGLIGKPVRDITINGKKIKKLAVCGGSGGALIPRVVEKGAEAFIVGEAGYHDQLLAKDLGLELIIKGHYETEVLAMPVLSEKLRAQGLTVI